MASERPHVLTIDLRQLDRAQVDAAGGKGAGLGELTRIAEIHVPAGFCVTTHAHRRALAAASVDELLDRIVSAGADDRGAIAALSQQVRAAIERAPMPPDVEAAIAGSVAAFGAGTPFAVRSSATAEDRPEASFAGQHDTYLNVVGARSVIEHVRRCWASLFTERAIAYRARNAIDHRGVEMAVIVQQLLDPDAAGVMFTADPLTSNRRVVTIESTFGLGEALVSGRVVPDLHRVRDGEVVEVTVADKKIVVGVAVGGGTQEHALEDDRRRRSVLSDAQAVALSRIGRRIEAHFGTPQDIEWCLVGSTFHVVQSRPMTTIFPLPPVPAGEDRVFVSVGHNQMMTDAMKPLGLSFWQMTTPAPMAEAGGRLWVDVTARLATRAGRTMLMGLFSRGDPLLVDALETVIRRDGVLRREPADDGGGPVPPPFGNATDPIATDPGIVSALIEQTQASIDEARRQIATKHGVEVFDFITADLVELRALLSGQLTHKAALAGMEATWWLNDHLTEWLGDRTIVDTLTLSAAGNVTSEMGLALMDVADVIRPHPEVVAQLQRAVRDADLVDQLDGLAGGPASRRALEAYLERYGMRCVGEIDITRPRFAEDPSMLVPALLGDIRNFEAGAGRRRFAAGRARAESAATEVLARLRALPDGERKAGEAKAMIERLRTFIGFREFPKYGMVSRYFIYKQALLREADALVSAGVLGDRDDAFFLRFDELRDAVRDQRVDQAVIDERKASHRRHQALTPPRVLTTDGGGEMGELRRPDVPAGALGGLSASSGIVEGRARVVTSMADADLQPGDILVTAHTDPSWSPLFVTIAALVTEVGGLMTHGAVVAREYGLPAVVGVDHVTRRIRDGQQIRVNGTGGWVELLDP